MQEDKNMKELLMKHAVEETSADFTGNVMQRIESAYAAKPSVTPFKHKPLQMLIGTFVVVCVVLLVLSIYMHPAKLPFHFTVMLPAKYFSQFISFLIAFWVVMLINQLHNKKRAQTL